MQESFRMADLEKSINAICICQALLVLWRVLEQDSQELSCGLLVAVKFSRPQTAQHPFQQFASLEEHLCDLRPHRANQKAYVSRVQKYGKHNSIQTYMSG